MEFKDYYKVLGVEKSAASDEIKKKYRKLAKKYHPDANSGNLSGEEKFKEVSEAYDVLGDKDKRAKYDQMYDDVKSGRYNASGGFDPSGYSAWAGQNGRGYTTYTWTGGADQDGGFSDFFNMFFGGGLGRNVYEDLFGQAAAGGHTYSQNQVRYSARGQDITASVEIGIKKALRGGEETVILKFDSGEKKVKFNIPAGIQPGGVIKLAGLGNPGVGGGKNGDLLLEIILKPEAGFAVNGLDLEKQLEIYPWQAALGDEITVNTLEEKLNIKIPAGIQNGGKLRVAGRGYRDKSGRRGAITFIMKIVNPSQMSDEMRGLYEKLARQAKAEEKTAR